MRRSKMNWARKFLIFLLNVLSDCTWNWSESGLMCHAWWTSQLKPDPLVLKDMSSRWKCDKLQKHHVEHYSRERAAKTYKKYSNLLLQLTASDKVKPFLWLLKLRACVFIWILLLTNFFTTKRSKAQKSKKVPCLVEMEINSKLSLTQEEK